MIFIVQPDYLAIDPSHTVHLQGPPRAICTFAPLGLQFSSENTDHVLLSISIEPVGQCQAGQGLGMRLLCENVCVDLWPVSHYSFSAAVHKQKK